MRLSKSIVILALFCAVVVTWNLVFPSGTWRYKVTVRIETPEGTKIGYAVREMHVVHMPRILPEVHSSIDIEGEAVVVELGKRGVLYAVIETNDQYTVFNSFPVEGATTPKGIPYYKSLKPGTIASLAVRDYPTLVTFKDPADPKSVELVLETGPENKPGVVWHEQETMIKADHFESLFGKGVKLKDITVEMTDEKVTRGRVEKFLGQRHAVGPYTFIKRK